MTKRNKNNRIMKALALISSAAISVTTLCGAVFAEDSIYGTVAVETQVVDEWEVVYENDFGAESDFTNFYNKADSDYPIYPNMGTTKGGGGVKFTWSSDFKNQFGKNPSTGTMIRAYNGDSTKHSKGFWFDLDKVLEDNGPGTYKFSFRVTAKAGHGLVEGCLNTLENQSDLGKILWNIQSEWGTPEDEDIVGGVNIGGHVLCRRWDDTGTIDEQVFESVTYIPEDAEHLRFLFGGSVDYDASHAVGGNGWNPIAMDDLIISKKVSSAETDDLELKSTVVSVDGGEYSGYLISALYDENNALVDTDISELTDVGEEPVEIYTSVDISDVYGEDYTVKTFFADIDGHITPYGLSYDPTSSLFPNYNFENPFTEDYRVLKYANEVGLSADAAYSGVNGLKLDLDGGATYFSIGEGETVTKNEVSASTTAFAKTVWENGAGTYRISFMAKATDEATVKAEVRRHIFSTSKQDTNGNGSIEVTPHTYSDSEQITDEWNEIQLDVEIEPMTPWGGASEYVSYRRNNYPLKLVITGSGSVYVDDFKVEKISE